MDAPDHFACRIERWDGLLTDIQHLYTAATQ